MRALWILFAFFLASCGCGSKPSHRGVVRVGVDPTWSPLAFDELQPYVNGYAEDFLMEVSRYSGIEFEKINANWDTLLEGMRQDKYDAVLCSLPPYSFNQAKYNFSENFLDLGPVLVVPANANYSDLKNLSGELVGVITGDPAVLVVQKYPEVIIRNYPTIPDLLNAVANGDLEAAVLDRLLASSFVSDLYAGKLKIASQPMTELGLHAVSPKGTSERFIRLFNSSIEQMKKKKTLDNLQKKWNL